MANRVREVMTTPPVCLPAASPVVSAAMAMRDAGIGDVIVQEGDHVCGIVTDRDITVRVVAKELAPRETTLGDICSRDLAAVSVSDSIDHAAQVMRDHAVRRLPVLEGGQPVGIVSLGDLALGRDPDSVLGSISGTPPNT